MTTFIQYLSAVLSMASTVSQGPLQGGIAFGYLGPQGAVNPEGFRIRRSDSWLEKEATFPLLG